MKTMTPEQRERAKRIIREEANDILKQINRLQQRRSELLWELDNMLVEERGSERS